MKMDKGQRLVMIGDSITDCERKFPYGEGLFQGVGKGYVSLVDTLLQTAYPELNLRVTNMGIGGNTVRDLKERWQTDVLDLLEEYEHTLTELAEQVRPRLKGLVIMTPFYIERSAEDGMRRRMDEYGRAAHRVAERVGALFVDTQAVFEPMLGYVHPTAIASDRVHPSLTGHMLIARAFLQAIGFDWKRMSGEA
ncbi:SGNH/GDSL hydrolase family protein [Paenibacillus sp. AR247]|uniref:SGNH/GDSL hydrolase family protein n=1 Tax=Paenibacillus sp. AR247 TaxID=1631599 RepID=UPI000CF96E1B|nr:SGNH/GDSL hydrolase family protein [Paenibacillus sp. AR247]PQP90565.1 GDSL family lipase [Paenibacillus sp. AR247]